MQIYESSDIDKCAQLIEQLKSLRDMEEHSVFCKEIPKQAPREGLFKVEMNTLNKLGTKEALHKSVY